MTGVHSCVLVGLAPHLPSLWRPSVGPSWASLCSPGIVRLLAQQEALRWLTLSFASPRCLYFSKEAPGAAVCLRVGTWLPWVGTISGLWASFFLALPILLHLVKSFLNLERGKRQLGRNQRSLSPGALCWAAGLLPDLGRELRLRPCVSVEAVDKSLGRQVVMWIAHAQRSSWG